MRRSLSYDLTTARQAYEWVHKTYYDQWQGQGAREFEDAEQVTLMGRAFDRHAALTGDYPNNPGLNKLVLRVFVKAYDVIDRAYWPAHVAAAECFLFHNDPKEATAEIKLALAANPNDARCHELLALIALESFDFDGAERQIAMMRQVDATSAAADLVEARLLLQERQPVQAELPGRRVLAKQPKSIEAMGLLAAAYALELKEDKALEMLAAVEKLDPHNASAYHDVADVLGAMRQYPRAEKMYEVAIERAPWWTAPRNGLGLLLTQSGNEEKAKVVLEAAYALDPYNFRTTNYLILLDKLAKMARRESEHFVVFYDARQDPRRRPVFRRPPRRSRGGPSLPLSPSFPGSGWMDGRPLAVRTRDAGRAGLERVACVHATWGARTRGWGVHREIVGSRSGGQRCGGIREVGDRPVLTS